MKDKAREIQIEEIYSMVKDEQKRYAHGGDLGADKDVFFAIQPIITMIDRKYRGGKDHPPCNHFTTKESNG